MSSTLRFDALTATKSSVMTGSVLPFTVVLETDFIEVRLLPDARRFVAWAMSSAIAFRSYIAVIHSLPSTMSGSIAV